jgi:hypothetical protein
MAKNTGRGHRKGAVKQRSACQRGGTWFKQDNKTGRMLNGRPKEHKGRPQREVTTRLAAQRAASSFHKVHTGHSGHHAPPSHTYARSDMARAASGSA